MIRSKEKKEIILKNINYAGALTAFLLQKNGYSVKILLQNTLSTQFSPELSSIYPTSAKQLFSSLEKYRFLMKCSSVTPHLFYPRRVLMLSEKSLNKKTIQLFDTLAGREREGSYLAINLQTTNTYNILAQNFAPALLFSEHRFDQNQATIDLLLKAKQLGTKIVDGNTTNDTAVLQFSQTPLNFQAAIIKHSWQFPNDIRYSNRNFTLTLQATNNKTILHAYLHNRSISEKTLQDEILSFLKKLQISAPTEISKITYDLFRQKENENTIDNTSVNSLQETFRRIKKDLRKSDISLPSISKVLHESHQNQMNQAKFREIQNTCDEKFDLAKQTNIEYSHFAQLFYRYPGYIDDMIEKAYEMLSSTRDGEKIWEQVEVEHLENIRSKIIIK